MIKQDPIIAQGTNRSQTLGRGSIVNVCSAASIRGPPGSVEYNASKFAATGITNTAHTFRHACFCRQRVRACQVILTFFTTANEYGASQIRINAVCPRPIETPLLERSIAAILVPNIRTATADLTSLNRVGDVDEVADTILFSSQSSWKLCT
ncbi:uncharacterized protein RCO7_01612 [Rhynchosporium graminicola]|uniref:Uncharacterized protein n=1 Tax=Rhynchosporium graminicola TaxID=2792576 RepID=A0A1E1LRT0_9HELO|nr:uncharacterized protein RCO7_01612 [Rhynchosporium commune]